MPETFKPKKEIINPEKFVYRFEINLTTDNYHETYLLEGSEEVVRDKFAQLIQQEKQRFKTKIIFRNKIVSIINKNNTK